MIEDFAGEQKSARTTRKGRKPSAFDETVKAMKRLAEISCRLFGIQIRAFHITPQKQALP